MNKSMPRYATQTVPVATAARLGATPVRLMMVVVGNQTGNTTVQFKNATSDTGTVLLTLSALSGQSVVADFTSVGGIVFDVGCFVKPTGTNSVAYCWFE